MTSESQAVTTRAIGYRQLLSNSNFVLLWLAESISLVGDTFFLFAINWLILEKTGSALQVGGNLVITVFANIIFGSIGGVLADRWNRRRLLLTCDCLRGALVLCLAIVLSITQFNIWYIYVTNFLLTSISNFFYPAFQATIPNVLEKDALVTGRSLTTGTTNLLQALGSALSGILIIAIGTQPSIILNSLSFFISAFAIFLTSIPQAMAGIKRDASFFSMRRDIVDGWQYLYTKSILLSLFILFTLSNFGAAFTWPVHVVFAEKVLNGGPQLYGYLATASLFGGFVGAYLIGHYHKQVNKYAGLSFFIAAFIWGALCIVFGLISSIPFAIILRFFIGCMLSIFHIPIASLVDLNTQDEYRGRIWSTIGIGSSVVSVASVLLSGLAADQWTARASYLIAGILLIFSALVALAMPTVRKASIAASS